MRRLFKICLLFALLLAACSQAPDNPAMESNTILDDPQPVVSVELLGALNQGSEDYLPNSALTIENTISYKVQERMEVVNHGPGEPSKNNLWVALVRSIPPYQEVLSVAITPSSYTIITDEYGNQYAEFDLEGLAAGETAVVVIEYLVSVNQLTFDLGSCQGELPEFYTSPELHIESNNRQIVELSQQISTGLTTPCDIARAYYDHVGNNLIYTYNGKNWGAQAALGEMGSDCTEYSSLLIALCRAAGIPARYLEGLNYRGLNNQVEARMEHAWTEIFLPGIGWVPADPTLGREETTREHYFAELPADHIIVTIGRHPSTLRGHSYFTHLYWGGKHTEIEIQNYGWEIEINN